VTAQQKELVASLAERFREIPVEVFLVGGIVRDLLLGRTPRDIDLLLIASTQDQEESLRILSAIAGMDPIPFDRRSPATYRVVSSGVIIDCSFCEPGAMDEALLRRDFTINAMAAPLIGQIALGGGGAEVGGNSSLAPGELMDPLDGLADLRRKKIRAATPESLAEDPLRMLRAVRLAAVLPGFSMDESLTVDIQALAARIQEPAFERISLELEQILVSPRAGWAVRRLDELDLLSVIIPELEPLREQTQPVRYHDHDAFEHTLRALDETERLCLQGHPAGFRIPESNSQLILKWAALLHDVGKASTATVDEKGVTHFYGHENVSARLAGECLRRLRVPARISDPVIALIELHLRLGSLGGSGAGDKPIRRLLKAAGEKFLMLALLSLADRRAAGGRESERLEENLLAVTRRGLELRDEVSSLNALPPLLSGTEVMEIMNLEPGPRVGSLIGWLERLRLEKRISSCEEAIQMLRDLPDSRIED
jgi:poly(A) polymerase